MAGTALTTRFMLGAATLMLGPQANLWDLQPATHSVGLAKNITMSSDPTFVDLMQGAKNTIVYTMNTGNPVKISAEVYEYTAKNLTYGLSLDGTAVAPYTVTTTQRSTGIDGSPTPTTSVLVQSTTGFAAGDTIMIIPTDGTDDTALIRTISSVAASPAVITVSRAIGIDVANYVVNKVNLVSLGDTSPATGSFLACKLAGQLADGTPVVALFPKVKVIKGFSVAFGTEQYGNLPFEIQILDPVPSDTFYADFPSRKGALYIQ